MDRQKQKSYSRQLILHEKQAYQGAKMFYYGVLPFSIIGMIFFSAFLYEESTDLIRQKLISIVFKILLTTVTYISSVFLYRKCNKIQTYPAKKKPHLNSLSGQTEISDSINMDQIQPYGNQLTSNNLQHFEQDSTQLKLNNNKKKPKKHECTFCNKICEYRTRHCRKCQTCIQRYDHHCFWIGNCVGRHNHKYFYLFLLTQSLNNYIELKAILQIKQCVQLLEFSIHILIWIIIYSMLITCFGFLCFTGYLAIYHTMLICLSLTTWEQMRRQKISYLKYLPRGYNPFSIGLINNINKFFTEQTRQSNTQCYLEEWESFLPTYEEAKTIKPTFNLIENQYYSCC